ncbi:MAG: hypothetical protein QOJ65_1617 [Fimbriimonadaceae bacterium]|jgi:uncharacterized protein (DUF3084 family)|nr:hypothetical protein [Fimbriimonadaceae bacterium]
MDVISLGFLAIMVLAGGLVALMADKLGRTLGKKRLTLMGLRPRHTATLITVLAGMLIPFITVLFVAVVSQPVRQWMVEGRHAIEQRDHLTAQNKTLIGEQIKLQADVEELRNERRDADAKTLVAENKRREAQRLLARETRTVNMLQREASALTLQINHLNSSLRLMQGDLKSTQTNLLAAQVNLKRARVDYNVIKISYYELLRQAKELNKQNGNLIVDNEKLGKENEVLVAQNKKAKDDLERSEFLWENAKLRLDDAKASLNRLNSQLDFVNTQFETAQLYLATDLNTSRFKPIITQAGDELARVSVPANTTQEQAKGILAGLLKQAAARAEQLGAKPLQAADKQVIPAGATAGLFPRKSDRGVVLTPEEQEKQIIEGISGSNGDQVLVATSFSNAFGGEWVPLDVKLHQNPLVYRRDETVAELRVSGTADEAVISEKISEFLRNTVRPKALKDKMLPVSGQDEQFGSVSYNEIFQLARTIHSMERPVRVVAVAINDTRAADPLQLRFRVR